MFSKKQPLDLHRKSGLYLKNVPDKGRGVFCREDIAAGETIEITPVIILNEKDTDFAAKTTLLDYYFTAAGLSDSMKAWSDMADTDKSTCLAMGIVSFCNHMQLPNARYERREENNTLFFELKAVVDIPRDTEICISYGDTWLATRAHFRAHL